MNVSKYHTFTGHYHTVDVQTQCQSCWDKSVSLSHKDTLMWTKSSWHKQTSSTLLLLHVVFRQWWAHGQLTKMPTLGTGICQILSTNSRSPKTQMQHWYSKNVLFRTLPQLSKTCLPSSRAPAPTPVNHLALVYTRNDLWRPLIYSVNWNQCWARTAPLHPQVRT